MPELQMFIPITKVDAAKRLVYGIATAEAEDASGEVCDYATTKPYYEKWSGNIAKTTDGKSLGNLRAMHGHVAAGKVTQIEFNDAAKQIEICAKVVDDAEWNKVIEGVYTGFSQGGAYIKRWKDETSGLQRYTAQPSEVSLVDLPCLPSATFSMIKADGVVELRKFHIKEAQPAMPTNSEIAAHAADLAKVAGSDKWGEFVEAARAELTAEKAGPGEPKEVAEVAKVAEAAELAKGVEAAEIAKTHEDFEAAKAAELAKAEAAKAASTEIGLDKPVLTPSNNEHGDQVWKSNRDGTLFAKKAEMIAHNEAFDAAKEAGDATASVEKTMAELAAEIEKRTFTAAQRKKDAASGAAEKDGSFPIENAGDLRNAIHAYGRSSDKPKIKAHIIAEAKKLGLTDELPKGWDGSTKKITFIEEAGLEKGMGAVSRLSCLIDQLGDMRDCCLREAASEGDGSHLPALLQQNLDDLCATLRMMVEEETQELITSPDNDGDEAPSYFEYALGMSDGSFDSFRKFLPAKSADDLIAKRAVAKADAERVAAETKKAAEAVELAKAAEADLVKAAEDELNREKLLNKALAGKIDTMATQMIELLDKVQQIAEQPLPLPLLGAAGAVTKGGQDEIDERALAHKIASDPDFAALHFFKNAQQKPMAFGG